MNAAVLVVCILGVGLCNYIVDPYNLRGTEGSHTEKKEISYSRSYHHWKLAEFRNRPASVVFLGDSRMGNFYADNVDRMQEVFGNDSYDFSFGGATLYDCISAFWYANDKIGLRRVYLGLNFNLVNDRWPANRSGPAISLIESSLKYYLNPFISMVTFELLIQPLFPESSDIGDVSNFADPSAFWDFQLSHTAHQHYGQYVYPREGLSEIAKVARHCESKGIELVLVYFPTHVDLQNRVADYDLTDAYDESKRELSRMASLYDYDYANEVTSDRANFGDPYHFYRSVGRRLFEEVILGKSWMAKQSEPEVVGHER